MNVKVTVGILHQYTGIARVAESLIKPIASCHDVEVVRYSSDRHPQIYSGSKIKNNTFMTLPIE